MTETEAAPTCYRHTDRETYVRCTRCDRPICPDCMNEAAVGFQCPDCVREGNKSVRQARTVFGGRAHSEAYVTKALIALCVGAFAAQLASPQFDNRFMMSSLAVAFGGQWYRMLTVMFLHGFLLHLLLNMFSLYMLGSQVERLVGVARYVVLFVVSGFGASVLSYWMSDPRHTSVGASGAVFGLLGAYFVMARKLKADTSQLVMLIGVNIAIGFAGRGVIDNWAHFGGLATGALIGLIYTRVPRGRTQTAVQLGLAALVVVALGVATVLRTDDLRQGTVVVARSESAATTSSTGAPSR
jgi:membrane associated rhomboid family serine protease